MRTFASRGARGRPTPSAPFTLKFELKPDTNSGAADYTTDLFHVNGTSIGTFTSGPANPNGPDVWQAKTHDITSLVTIGQKITIRWQYSSGQDTGYVRRMYVEDASGNRYYGGYPDGAIYSLEQQETVLAADGSGSPSVLNATTNAYESNPPPSDGFAYYYVPASEFS